MESIKVRLIDNDHVVRAKTDFASKGQDDQFKKFLQEITAELIIGQTAYLEIEGLKDPITFELSKFE